MSHTLDTLPAWATGLWPAPDGVLEAPGHDQTARRLRQLAKRLLRRPVPSAPKPTTTNPADNARPPSANGSSAARSRARPWSRLMRPSAIRRAMSSSKVREPSARLLVIASLMPERSPLMSAAKTGTNGRHPLPPRADPVETLRRPLHRLELRLVDGAERDVVRLGCKRDIELLDTVRRDAELDAGGDRCADAGLEQDALDLHLGDGGGGGDF